MWMREKCKFSENLFNLGKSKSTKIQNFCTDTVLGLSMRTSRQRRRSGGPSLASESDTRT